MLIISKITNFFVTFNDGSKKNVDLKPYLTGEVFGELLDKDKFIRERAHYLNLQRFFVIGVKN